MHDSHYLAAWPNNFPTVAFRRLDRVREGKHPTTGKRMYSSKPVRPEDLTAIREAIIHVLGLSGLTK